MENNTNKRKYPGRAVFYLMEDGHFKFFNGIKAFCETYPQISEDALYQGFKRKNPYPLKKGLTGMLYYGELIRPLKTD